MPQHRWLRGWSLIATTVVLTLAACGTPDSGSSAAQPSAPAPTEPAPQATATPSRLTEGAWRLVRLGPAAQPTTPDSDTITARFGADGKFSGSGGCNSYGGAYTVTGTALQIDQVASTMMACMDQNVMAQETQYLAALGAASELEETDTTLTLRYAEGELVYEFVPPPPARTLDTTLWRFNGFAENDAVSMIAGAEAITFELRDGTITGNGGCNRYNGSATVQDQQLTVGPLVSTKMACDTLAAEQQFMTALQRVTAWEIKDQTLTLQYPDGSLLFVAE